MDQTKEQLKKAFEKVPEKLQHYIVTSDWENKLLSILAAQNLTDEQTTEITSEVLLVLLGTTDPDDLSLAIRTVANLPNEQSEQLAKEISAEILSPVEDELLELDPTAVEDYTAYQNLPTEIKEALNKLPEQLRQIVLSVETADHIQMIGQKHNLHIDQMGELDTVVSRVMLGLTKSEDFLSHIKNRLQLDQTTVEQITREVNEQIFLPIRESLMKLHANANEATEAKEALSGGVQTFPTTQIEASAATEGKLPDKDKLLSEIENPDKTETDKAFEKKLGQLFRIPREEVDLDPYNEKPE